MTRVRRINGTGVQIIVGGDFQLNAVSSLQNTNVSSSSNGGGLVSSVNADSTANLGGTTQAVVGKNASVQAQTVSILADYTVGDRATINASATAGGLFGSATANTNGTWNPVGRRGDRRRAGPTPPSRAPKASISGR